MKTLKLTSTLILLLILLGCTASPEPIDYGNDGCFFCKMTIVDKIHAAEIVTTKGKVYKFDAMECLLQALEEFETDDVALLLTNHYNEPEVLIDAYQASFLISENIPSPMGAYLSAFKQLSEAEKIQSEKGGQIYTFETLKSHLKN